MYISDAWNYLLVIKTNKKTLVKEQFDIPILVCLLKLDQK